MEHKIKSKKKNAFFMSLLSLIYGMILIIWPDTSAKTLCYVVGVAIIFVGVFYIVQYAKKDVARDYYQNELVYGLFALIIGIIALIKVEMIQSIIPIALGIVVLFSGIVKLQNAFDLFRLKMPNWPVVMVFAVINTAIALILLMQPIWVVNMLFRLIGIGLAFSGISDLLTILFFSKQVGKEQ